MTSPVADVKLAMDKQIETRLESVTQQSITKSSLIDQELHKNGMGRYQWMIWAVCGTGFIMDVMWIQAYTLALSGIQHEFGFSDKQLGNIGSAFLAGVATGAFIWGALVDVVGRQVAFLSTCLISGVFGMCIGAMSSYSGLLVMMAFVGFGVGGNMPVDSTITVEYLPADRYYLLAGLSIFQTVGTITSTAIAYGFIPNYSCSENLVSCHLTGGVAPCCSKEDNMGWRYVFFSIASITLAVFVLRFFIFPIYESPKFLLSKGKDHAAVEVIQRVAAFNGHSCDLSVESLYDQCVDTPVEKETRFHKQVVNEISRLKLLFGNWRMARIAIIVWITWIFNDWGLSISLTFLPVILQRKNSAISVSLKQTYIDYLTIYPPGLFGTVLAVLMVRMPMIGRKWTLVFSSMFMGISLFLYGAVNTEASHVGLNLLEYFCQAFFVAVLYGWTPESFPLAVRGTATGMAYSFGCLFAISGPLIGAQVFSLTGGGDAVLYLAGGSLFVCTISLLCLPVKDMVAPR